MGSVAALLFGACFTATQHQNHSDIRHKLLSMFLLKSLIPYSMNVKQIHFSEVVWSTTSFTDHYDPRHVLRSFHRSGFWSNDFTRTKRIIFLMIIRKPMSGRIFLTNFSSRLVGMFITRTKEIHTNARSASSRASRSKGAGIAIVRAHEKSGAGAVVSKVN